MTMNDSPERYDAIVVGAGQAGPSVAIHLAESGRRVALIERDRVGGTCLNSGCRPTKALRASARVAYLARRASDYGVQLGDVSVDLPAAMARKDRMIGRWRDGFADYLMSLDKLELIRGHARFSPSSGGGGGGEGGGVHEMVVNGRRLSSELIVLDVGARPRVPDIPGLSEIPYLTNESLLQLPSLPSHLLVLGGSYIGLEFAQMFRRLGSEVTVLEAGPRVAGREDHDVSEAIQRIIEKDGVQVHCGAAVERFSATDERVEAHLADGKTLSGDKVLIAVGRIPNTDRLGLECVGLEVDRRGYLRTDGVFRTAVPGIIALGDINGRGAFTHTAYQDAEIFIDHLQGGKRSADSRIMTYALFTDPPLGRVGLNESEARATGRRVLSASYPMERLTKAVLDGETEGLVKVLVDAESDCFLGATCLGLFGDEIVQVVSAMMHAKAPCHVLAEMLPVHPTVAEFYPTILKGLKPLV
ncbi:MAG: mercuric reductase [Myxococcota bacterium]